MKDGQMVDITEKEITARRAVAVATLSAEKTTIEKIRDKSLTKGDALETAKVAGINAVKSTPKMIIYAHPIKITSINFEFDISAETIEIKCTVKTMDRTGVEMEALVGATVAALNIYDMIKSIDRQSQVTDIKLLEKSGGKSGEYVRKS